jgi:predicted amidophosphoribosyltransferase
LYKNNLKYKGHEEIGTLLGHWYGEDLKDVFAVHKPDVSLFLCTKYKERGFNQVTTFGLAFLKN